MSDRFPDSPPHLLPLDKPADLEQLAELFVGYRVEQGLRVSLIPDDLGHLIRKFAEDAEYDTLRFDEEEDLMAFQAKVLVRLVTEHPLICQPPLELWQAADLYDGPYQAATNRPLPTVLDKARRQHDLAAGNRQVFRQAHTIGEARSEVNKAEHAHKASSKEASRLLKKQAAKEAEAQEWAQKAAEAAEQEAADQLRVQQAREQLALLERAEQDAQEAEELIG